MASPNSIWTGVTVLFMGVFISIILFISVVYPAERIVTTFEETTMFAGGGGIYDVPAPWDMGYADALYWLKLMYIVASLPAILGVLILFLSTVKTQSYDIFGTSDVQNPDQLPLETYNPPQTFTPEFSKGGLF